jgi:hypothetical protein
MKRIDNTRKIPINSLLRVYKKGFGYSKVTIVDVNEDFFGGLVDDDFYNFIRDGDIVDAYLWVEHAASYDFKLQVIGRISLPPRIVFFRHSDDLAFSRERRCLRARVALPFRFFVIETGETGGVFTSEKVVHHNGTFIEMSDREAVFTSDISIPENSIVRGHIEINSRDIEIVGPIQIGQAPGGDFHYEITYNGLNGSERNRILDYVIGIYRE